MKRLDGIDKEPERERGGKGRRRERGVRGERGAEQET